MGMQQLINPLVSFALVAMMITIGLTVSLHEVASLRRKPGMVARGLVANYLFFPLVAVLLLALFHARPLVAAGFLILAVCPGAPYAPACTALAKGNVALAVGLMLVLAGSSVLLSPLLLGVLLGKLGHDEALRIDTWQIVGTLLVTQLVPLFLGLVVHQRAPSLAAKLKDPLAVATRILIFLAFALVIVVQFHTLREIRLRGVLGMSILLGASLIIGWLSGGPGAASRRAVAQVTALRNAGVALVIATKSFPGTPAVSAVVMYALFSIVGSSLVAAAWGRRALVPSKVR